MKRKLYLSILYFVLSSVTCLYAQQQDYSPYYHNQSKRGGNDSGNEIVTNSVGNSNTGGNIDVVFHRCDWSIDPSVSKVISGTVTTYFKTLSANVNTLTFDFNKTSFNNGLLNVTYHGTACTKSFPLSGAIDTLTITLPVTIAAAGTLDSVSITYSGTPPAVNGQAEGFQRKQDGSGNWYIYTLSESYEDKDWWPCKADMQDKIDSMDINITVPNTYWVAANGIMTDSAISGANRTFRFKHRHPIASYLVAIGVAKYNRFHRPPVTIGAVNIPVVYNIFPDQGANPTTLLTAMDKSKQEIVAFSNMYGLYPFANEKHGFYQFGWGGGMEHQSFSAMSAGSMNSWSTIAHELMHQWFGDNVSFATWNDLWLAEGFARYGEVLAAEKVSVGTSAYSVRNTLKNGAGGALSYPTTETWIPNANIANSETIWSSNYGSTVYERGGMIVSMLRTLAGDAKFSEATTNYQTSLAGKSATTDSLKRFFNTALGVDLTEFFNDYVGGSGSGTTSVGGKGSPRYAINWNTRTGNQLVLQVGSQTKTASSNVTYFNGPVVIHATNAASGWTKDTTIVFFDWGGGNLSTAGNGIGAQIPGNMLVYNLSFTATNIFIDDSARTLIDVANSSVTKLAALATDFSTFTAQKAGAVNDIKLTVNSTDPITKVVLEKSSDGVNFVAEGEMNLTGSVTNEFKYHFADMFPYTDITFYRAKIYVANGSIKYSTIAKVTQAADAAVTVSPNPVVNSLNVTFPNNQGEKVTIHVLSAEGKIIKEATTNNNYIHFDTQKLAAGTYLVQVIKQGQPTATQKFVVSH